MVAQVALATAAARPHDSFSTCSGKMPGANALVVNDDVEESGMHFNVAVVFDQAELPKLVHELIDARAGRANARR